MTLRARKIKSKVRWSKNEPIRVIILGAGGWDFHNFNTFFRNRPEYRVVAFTATQIPFIANRLIITKVNEGSEESLKKIKKNIFLANPRAKVLEAPSVVHLDHPEWVEGRRVLVIEDGPTITHGGMPHGAGASASIKLARELIDPRPTPKPSPGVYPEEAEGLTF